MIKILFSIFLISLILMAGVFCQQGIQMMDMGCSGSTSLVWCSDFLFHGTIVSDAILTIIFTILSILIVLVFVKPFLNILKIIRQVISHTPRIRDRIPIFSPIQLAISNGIIHPRIP